MGNCWPCQKSSERTTLLVPWSQNIVDAQDDDKSVKTPRLFLKNTDNLLTIVLWVISLADCLTDWVNCFYYVLGLYPICFFSYEVAASLLAFTTLGTISLIVEQVFLVRHAKATHVYNVSAADEELKTSEHAHEIAETVTAVLEDVPLLIINIFFIEPCLTNSRLPVLHLVTIVASLFSLLYRFVKQLLLCWSNFVEFVETLFVFLGLALSLVCLYEGTRPIHELTNFVALGNVVNDTHLLLVSTVQVERTAQHHALSTNITCRKYRDFSAFTSGEEVPCWPEECLVKFEFMYKRANIYYSVDMPNDPSFCRETASNVTHPLLRKDLVEKDIHFFREEHSQCKGKPIYQVIPWE